MPHERGPDSPGNDATEINAPFSEPSRTRHPARLLLILILCLCGAGAAIAQDVDLKAEYRFDPDLQPLSPGSTLTAFGTSEDALRRCNTTSSSLPLSGSWTWTSSCFRGRGFIIDVEEDISSDYSIGLRFEFDEVADGYNKIIDFNDAQSDNGFYFQNGQILF